MSTSDVNPGFPSGPKNIVFRAVQSHYLLEFRALLLCARFTASCERRFLAGFPVYHFEDVHRRLV
jgi:hypothetical protein